MRNFVITTETNSDLSKEYLEENHIGVIPHYYTVEDEVYGDEKELTTKEFYDYMRAEKKAATMASNPAVILETFEGYAKQGMDILHISFSSALSSGYNNVVLGGKEICAEFPEMKIVVIDTLSASLGEGMMIMKAIEMKKEGKTIDEIVAWIEANKKYISVQFTVDDLNHLYRGGRLSKTTAIVGSMIKIKPVLYINEEGELLPKGKTRGRKNSLNMLVDIMENNLGSLKDKQIMIGIIHGDSEDEALYVKKLVMERLSYQEDMILIRPIGPSIGAHSGPGTVGLAYMGEKK